MVKSLLLTFMLCPIVMSAQTAKVQALTPFEAAEAKSLYQQKSDLDKRISDFRDSLVKEYIETKDPKQAAGSSYVWFSTASGQYYYRAGWNNDSFLFSDDFKYIVPTPPAKTSGQLCIGYSCGTTLTPYYSNGTFTTTPAITLN